MESMPPEPASNCAPRGIAFEPFPGSILDTIIVSDQGR